MRQEIQDWARIESAPNRNELIELYRALVHPGCPDIAVLTLPDRELIKSICVSVFMAYYKRYAKWRICRLLSDAFIIPERTIYSYLPTLEGRIFHSDISVSDRNGIGLGKFDTVKEASAATGVPIQDIYRALQRGGTSGGYRFTSDIAKPKL